MQVLNESPISLNPHASVNQRDVDFLSRFYRITGQADWCLKRDNDNNYQLLNHVNQLALTIDFRCGNYRHRNHYHSKEPLLKAIKIKQKLPKYVLDTTPGVLKDSFMLAGRGIEVTAIERNPLLYIMVNDALDKVETSITYYFGDAKAELVNYTPDIIYLDPMYPDKKKSAQVKKDMQILHQLIGADSDGDQLLLSARQHASTIQARIVVKRPSYAKPLGGQSPDFNYRSSHTRFDIYLPT